VLSARTEETAKIVNLTIEDPLPSIDELCYQQGTTDIRSN
jgi:hypothetical protein